MKKVTMKRPTEADLDAFVAGATPAPAAPAAAPAAPPEANSAEETKRLTLDIPKSLHKAFKAACAERETSMVEDITAYIRGRCGRD